MKVHMHDSAIIKFKTPQGAWLTDFKKSGVDITRSTPDTVLLGRFSMYDYSECFWGQPHLPAWILCEQP